MQKYRLRPLLLAMLASAMGATICASANAQTYSGTSGRQTFEIIGDPQYKQLDRYSSYPYDPNLDPKRLPPATYPSADQPAKNLATTSGIDLGAQISGYQYEEPSLGVKISGPKLGFNASATGTFSHNWFATGNFRGAFGYSDYSGSGTINNVFETLWDIRGLLGRDFIFHSFSLSPFLGFGYRDFSSDDRGTSSTGAHGYRRENQLWYIPVGIEPRFSVDDDSRVAVNFEYDYVASGQQTSKLSDVGTGVPDLTNSQKSGYGLRGNVMWEFKHLALGPFVDYWSIQQSDTACASGSAVGLCGYEPTNHTIEGGFEVLYHIY